MVQHVELFPQSLDGIVAKAIVDAEQSARAMSDLQELVRRWQGFARFKVVVSGSRCTMFEYFVQRRERQLVREMLPLLLTDPIYFGLLEEDA